MKKKDLQLLIFRLKERSYSKYLNLLYLMYKEYNMITKVSSYNYNKENGTLKVTIITIINHDKKDILLKDIYTLNKQLLIEYMCSKYNKNINNFINNIPVREVEP